MKKTLIPLIIIAIILAGVVILFPYFLRGYWITMEFLNPHIHEQLIKEWEKKSTGFLLKKLNSKVDVYYSTAIDILYERQEKKAVPILLKLIKSKDEQTRISAFIALGEFNDRRAIEPMMEIINKGPEHRDYINALRAFSYMRYEPVFPLIVQLISSKPGEKLYDDRSYGVNMLERYGNSEAILVLQNIAINDPEEYIRDKAKDAIQNIEKASQIK